VSRHNLHKGNPGTTRKARATIGPLLCHPLSRSLINPLSLDLLGSRSPLVHGPDLRRWMQAERIRTESSLLRLSTFSLSLPFAVPHTNAAAGQPLGFSSTKKRDRVQKHAMPCHAMPSRAFDAKRTRRERESRGPRHAEGEGAGKHTDIPRQRHVSRPAGHEAKSRHHTTPGDT